jgi:hypothetical protein
MADRKRATGGGERKGIMCDVLIFGARTPGYDSDPSDYADVGRKKSSRSRRVVRFLIVVNVRGEMMSDKDLHILTGAWTREI